MEEANQKIVQKIKSICTERQIRPAQFARLIGVSRQQVYRWFKFSQRMPDSRIEKAAESLDLDPAVLRYDLAINAERLTNIIGNLRALAAQRDIRLTDAQFATITSIVYSDQTDTRIERFLDVLSA